MLLDNNRAMRVFHAWIGNNGNNLKTRSLAKSLYYTESEHSMIDVFFWFYLSPYINMFPLKVNLILKCNYNNYFVNNIFIKTFWFIRSV